MVQTRLARALAFRQRLQRLRFLNTEWAAVVSPMAGMLTVVLVRFVGMLGCIWRGRLRLPPTKRLGHGDAPYGATVKCKFPSQGWPSADTMRQLTR